MQFKDLTFNPRQFGGGFGTHTEINGFVLSVQASSMSYCTPREDLTSVDDYASFEIAVWEADGDRNWVTRDFFLDHTDDVVGWQSREDIDKLIRELESYER
jgi:hypothetical protein